MKKISVLLAFSILLSVAAFASNEITGIRINGNKTTKAFVIENLLGYRPGMKVDLDRLFEVQNVMLDSGLFSNVYMNLNDATDGNYALEVDVNENPYIKPTLDLVKGIGIDDSNIFGLGLDGEASLRFFNLSPFEVFYGGYAVSLSSLRALGTPFSFAVSLSKLDNMQFYEPSGRFFYYDVSHFDLGIGSMVSQTVGVLGGYIHEDVTPATQTAYSVDSVYLNLSKYIGQVQDSRAYWWGDVNLEHGMNQWAYNVITADYNLHYRMIARIYTQARLYGVINSRNAPFTRKEYLGDTYNLKGYSEDEFGDPYMVLGELKFGLPLTASFGISNSPDMTSYTVELISQLAFVTDGNDLSLSDFKPSVGLGLKLNTPFGVYEPEIFFGKQFGFYLEF